LRTTLDLDEDLLKEAMEWTGNRTKTTAIHAALKHVISYNKRLKLINLAGKINLDVDLDVTRNR
jgi:Arc/MetJ family transcription regulator